MGHHPILAARAKRSTARWFLSHLSRSCSQDEVSNDPLSDVGATALPLLFVLSWRRPPPESFISPGECGERGAEGRPDQNVRTMNSAHLACPSPDNNRRQSGKTPLERSRSDLVNDRPEQVPAVLLSAVLDHGSADLQLTGGAISQYRPRLGTSMGPWGAMNATRRTAVLVATCVAVLSLATLLWLSGEDMILGWMLIFVVVGWGLLVAFGIVLSVRARRHRSVRHRLVLGWICCSLALTGSLAIGFAGVPEHIRFRLSRDALIDAGQQVLKGEHPKRAGLYSFDKTSVMGDCAMMRTGTFAISEFGWAYCPTGRPVPPSSKHVEGQLYKYDFD
jgi:hypothetical protein